MRPPVHVRTNSGAGAGNASRTVRGGARAGENGPSVVVDAMITPARNSEGNSQTMAIQRTFSIIKPDATRRNLTGAINAKLEAAGLRIVAQKRIHLSLAQAQTFYGVHKDRPFFGELTEFMSSAPIVAQVLEGEDAIAKNREVMGATNPAEAAEGTIRKEFALSIGENSVHGSDGSETAATEIAYFFSGLEIVG
jgi:nucleoside-diphosphate kinase